MKKNVIALLLAVVMASGSIGSVPALAAETTAQEAVAVEEITVEEPEEIPEEADSIEASETTAEETVAVEEETVEEAEEIHEEADSVKASKTTAEETVTVEEGTIDSEKTPEETKEAVTDENEEASVGEAMEEVEAEPEQDLSEVVEETKEVETTEDEEPAVTEEEVIESEAKEPALAEGDDVVDSGTCGKNVTWVLTGAGDDLTLTISGSGIMYNWSFFGAPWYSSSKKIKNVVVENGVTNIGWNAFNDFRSLTSITIPNSVTSIGQYAFSDCSSLTSITIPDSVITIEHQAFQGCNLKEIHINSLEAWLNIDFCDKSFSGYYESIGIWGDYKNASFSGDIYLNGTLLINAIIPDTVAKIRDFAFSGCRSLTSVTIPDSVTSIGEYAFHGCRSLTSVTIPNGVTIIRNNVFYNCDKLESVTIPDSVTSIGGSAFAHCSSLTSITIPDSVTSIGGCVFYECSSLTSVTIPNSVTSIGNYTFSDCYNLTSITIPDSVTSIGNSTFSYCKSLTSITIPDSVTSIGEAAFTDCSSLTSITIPDSVTSIGEHVFSNCERLTSITIPDSVTSVGNSTFSYCKSLTSITIPDNVTSIGEYAFSGCSSLTSITIPDSVTSIGEHAFSCCSSFTSITIPDSVTSIAKSTFSGCSSLTSITIPDNVTSIGEDAFDSCSSLTSITIPDSVTGIGGSAFRVCISLKSVYFSGNAPVIDTDSFANVTATAYYPANNPTWTEAVRENYGGNVTWVTWIPDGSGETTNKDFSFNTDSEGNNQNKYSVIDGKNALLTGTLVVDDSVVDAADKPSQTLWSVSDESVAVIDNIEWSSTWEGIYEFSVSIRGLKPGKVTLTGTAFNGEVITSEVFVEPKTEITVTPSQVAETENSARLSFKVFLNDADRDFLEAYTQSLQCKFLARYGSRYPSYYVAVDVPDGFEDVTKEVVKQGEDDTWSIMNAWSISVDGKSAEFITTFYPQANATYTIYPTFITQSGYEIQTSVKVFAPESAYGIDYYAKEETESQKYLQGLYEDYISSFDNYIASVIKDLQNESKNEGIDYVAMYTQQAKAMMDVDDGNQYLTFDSFTSKDYKLYAYIALCRMMYECGSKRIDFSNINFSDTISASSSVVKTIAASMSNYSQVFTDIHPGVSIDINYFGISGSGFGSMNINGHTVIICQKTEVENAVAEYLNQLKVLSSHSINGVYYNAIKDLTGVSVSSINQSMIDKSLKPLSDLFARAGLPNALNNIQVFYGYYQYCQKLANFKFDETSFKTFSDDIQKMNSWVDGNPVLSDSLSQKASGKMSKAYNLLADAVREYYTTGEIQATHSIGYKIGNKIKAIFKCPVAITVYSETGEEIGYVDDYETYYEDGILITEACGVKTIYSDPGQKLTYKVVGTGSGTVSCTFEELVNGTPTGRINYYDYQIEEGESFEAKLITGSIEDNNSIELSDDSGVTEGGEYISAADPDSSAIITIEKSEEAAGNTYGEGRYPKGDAAILFAQPSEGFAFSGWYDSDGKLISASNYYEHIVSKSVKYRAVFFRLDGGESIVPGTSGENLTDGCSLTKTPISSIANANGNEIELDKGSYDVQEGEALTIDATIKTDKDRIDGQNEYIGYFAYYANGTWNQLASWDIEGGTTKYAIKLTKERWDKDGDVLFTVSVFPKDYFVQGAALIDKVFLVNISKKAHDPEVDDKIDISSYTLQFDSTSFVYSGKAIQPSISVIDSGVSLKNNTDYTVSYKNNINVGTASITITGKGNYFGSVTKTFTITPKPVTNLTISGIASKTYNGKAQSQAVVVKDGNTTLANGTHYTVSYKNNINAGTASVVIAGKGNYGGAVTKTFTIGKAANAITAKNFTKTYSTKAQSFSLGAKAKGGTLTYASNNKYVTVSKAGKVTIKAKYVGKAVIAITAQNSNYNKVTKKITVTVNPTKTVILKVTSPAKSKMTVKWKKNTTGGGYQIQCATDSKFSKNKKTVTVKGSAKIGKTITGLTAGKKYYVRIRTYKTVSKVNFYSAWSAAKAVTVKK